MRPDENNILILEPQLDFRLFYFKTSYYWSCVDIKTKSFVGVSEKEKRIYRLTHEMFCNGSTNIHHLQDIANDGNYFGKQGAQKCRIITGTFP